jgi:hypothetical protein
LPIHLGRRPSTISALPPTSNARARSPCRLAGTPVLASAAVLLLLVDEVVAVPAPLVEVVFFEDELLLAEPVALELPERDTVVPMAPPDVVRDAPELPEADDPPAVVEDVGRTVTVGRTVPLGRGRVGVVVAVAVAVEDALPDDGVVVGVTGTKMFLIDELHTTVAPPPLPEPTH